MKNNKIPTFIDFCSGIGTARKALVTEGFSCLGFSEIDENAINTYRQLYDTNEPNFGDIMNIEKIPKVDLMVAGFPCQSFSIVGKRQGFDGLQGNVIFGLINILKKNNIPYFLLENVKGLLTSNKGNDFKSIIDELTKIGYTVQYKIINSMQFSLPHSRERVYIVGIKNNLNCNNFQFPIGNNTLDDITLYISPSEEDKILINTKEYDSLIRYLNNSYNKGKYKINDILKLEDNTFVDTRQSDLRIYKGYSPTIRKGRQGILYIKNHNLYKLNKMDAMRLQGFNNFDCSKTIDIPKSILFAQVGNAMSIPIISAIAKNIKKIIMENK